MGSVFEITRQDFNAAKAAFDDDDFQQMNIYANRLISNAVFGENEGRLYALPGFFIKNLAIEFYVIKDEQVAKELHRRAEVFISTVDSAFKPKVDSGFLWEGYFEFLNSRRQLLMNPIDKRTYKEDTTFTKKAFAWLTREVFETDAVYHEHSLALTAFLSEGERLATNHGIEQPYEVLLSLTRALTWLNDYYRIVCSTKAGLDLECLKASLLPHCEKLKEWAKQKEESPYNRASDILCDLLIEWRKCFIRYMDRGRVSVEEDRRIELPVEVKKRIGTTVAQALQNDFKKIKR